MVFQQLLLTVDYCHRLGVANRDIKLDNVLLTSSKKPAAIKLTGFGVCKRDKHSIAKPLVGTAIYTGMQSDLPKASHAPCADCSTSSVMITQHEPFGTSSPIPHRCVVC